MSKVFTITEGLENMGALKTGGQGSVYKTRRTGVVITAVKLIPTPIFNENLSDKNYVSFQNEVEKLRKVNEEPIPNVVKILSSGVSETGSFPFIEMEFIEGPDLEECLKPPHDGIFTIKETIKVAEHLANALAHCHKQDVKHGDIKSNNVKYNVHTGNYVLLDFGMAVMSDEQRRTSLRQAGAIEFMAPEQSNGSMLFETDIYSYGVVLYELLAGRVPFVLNDRNESSRNMIMVAHMETPPPDLMELRKQHLPSYWDDEQKAHELLVPSWLLEMIYKCLKKKPADRFPNGIELQKYITRNSVAAVGNTESADALLQENKKLKAENDTLRSRLEQLSASASPAASVKNTASPAPVRARTSGSSSGVKAVAITALLAGLAFLGYYLLSHRNSEERTAATADTPVAAQGEYVVVAPKAYFHNEPDASTRRDAYLVPSNEIIKTTDERNGFVYTDFTNSNGKTSSGWIRKKDLVTLEEWNRIKKNEKDNPPDETASLEEARTALKRGDVNKATAIYGELVKQGVPEAEYQYANLTLHNLNPAIDCSEALRLLKDASNAGYTPAKRTLGTLYLFADDREFLQQHNYDHCALDENTDAGTRLLSDAALEGDPDAQGLLDEYEAKNNTVTPQ